jgi:hypothetical protein
MKFRYFKYILVLSGIVAASSCKKMMDINKDPDRIPDANPPIEQLLPSAQVNLAFEAGSDLFRYATLIMQQMSGGASQPNQTYEYGRYNITGSDQNNVWSSIFSTTLNDLEAIIKTATANGSPHFTGVAKILKAYEYALVVDTWGDVPYTEAQQLTANVQPAYDDDATIYPKLIALLTEAVTDINAATSALTPATTSSVIYPGAWATVKNNWIKLANTLRLRLLLHYSKKDPAFMVAQMTTLINSGAAFFASNADNFQLGFFNVANQRNPISAFEVSRPNYLFADARIVDMMTSKADPRRPFYFTSFPWNSGNYLGVSATALPPAPNNNYSRVHTFLRGAVTAGATPPFTYSGAAPQRMLTFAEYNFIRAEAALAGAPGDAQAFFTAGITASMQEAGVAAGDITTYLTANGTLVGTNAQKLRQIIEEKYVANFGVPVEPWTDWRRTGYPTLSVAANAINTVTAIPRSFFYPQSEIDLNPNAPDQKNANLQDRIFWDTP